MLNKKTKTLRSVNHIFRKATRDDVESVFYNWASDSDTTKYLCWHTYKEISDSEDWIESVISHYGKLDYYVWIVEDRNTGETIGACNISIEDEENECVEFNYVIGGKWHTLETAQDVIRTLISFAFFVLKAKKVVSVSHVDDKRRISELESMGLHVADKRKFDEYLKGSKVIPAYTYHANIESMF